MKIVWPKYVRTENDHEEDHPSDAQRFRTTSNEAQILVYIERRRSLKLFTCRLNLS